jgi:hypothetical protein
MLFLKLSVRFDVITLNNLLIRSFRDYDLSFNVKNTSFQSLAYYKLEMKFLAHSALCSGVNELNSPVKNRCNRSRPSFKACYLMPTTLSSIHRQDLKATLAKSIRSYFPVYFPV